MSFCSLTKGISPKICRLCVRVIINKCSFEEKQNKNKNCTKQKVLLMNSFLSLLPPPHPPPTPFLSQGDNHQALKAVGKSTTMDLDLSSMAEGTRYYVTVRAWNGAGLSTTVVSDGIVKDHTPPRPGHVFLSSRHAADHVTEDVTTLRASWHGFEDLQSGVASYSVALFDVGDLTTPVVDFVEVGFRTEHVFHGLSLQHLHR